MLTIKQIRENRAYTIERLAVKGVDAAEAVDRIEKLDDERKSIQARLDGNLAEQNAIAKEIGMLFKQGKKDEAEAAKARTAALKEASKELDGRLRDVEAELNAEIVKLPNFPNKDVPHGLTAADNVVVRTGGATPELPSDALPHWELARKYDIIDFELGVKLTGAGFPVSKGQGSALQRALISFFLDCNTADNFYMIPTAEVPVTNIYRDMILSESDFPVKMTAYTPCFRREAGSYGKDVRGLNRLHQFDKVEIVQIAHPDRSYEALDGMIAHVESIVRKLELPYRILRLCGGDMSFTSAITYDFEVFSAAQQRWLEVSSVSNFESFQAYRLKLRYRDANKRTQLCHTLNGSSLALPRIVAALLENNQTPEGIRIPAALVPYTRFDTIK